MVLDSPATSADPLGDDGDDLFLFDAVLKLLDVELEINNFDGYLLINHNSYYIKVKFRVFFIPINILTF